MHQLLSPLVCLVGSVSAAAFLVSCSSSDPFCGDGTRDPGEQCDDGNRNHDDFCNNQCIVVLPPQLTIRWEFNSDQTLGFSGDSCTDLGVFRVAVELMGPGGPYEMQEGCALRQVVFSDLPSGDYTARLTPLGAGDTSKTSTPIEHSFSLSGSRTETVVVPNTAWTSDYTGTLFFRVSWAGQDCSSATPSVDEQILELKVDGVTVAGTTLAGDPLDGSAPGNCQSVSAEFPQTARDVPFGRAEFTVRGRSNGDVAFENTFDTFIGAGPTNPEYLFDVQATSTSPQ